MAETNPSKLGGAIPVTSVSTADLGSGKVANPSDAPDSLYPAGVPEPAGTSPETEARASEGGGTDPDAGSGVDGEVVVWEARYSKRNFIGRIIVRALLTIACVALAIYTWGMGHDRYATFTWIAGGAVVLLWVALLLRIM